MAKVYQKITDLIGSTPLLKLNNIIKNENLEADVYAKLEYFNPAGSVKDRIALNMIIEAERSGKITEGAVLIAETRRGNH